MPLTNRNSKVPRKAGKVTIMQQQQQKQRQRQQPEGYHHEYTEKDIPFDVTEAEHILTTTTATQQLGEVETLFVRDLRKSFVKDRDLQRLTMQHEIPPPLPEDTTSALQFTDDEEEDVAAATNNNSGLSDRQQRQYRSSASTVSWSSTTSIASHPHHSQHNHRYRRNSSSSLLIPLAIVLLGCGAACVLVVVGWSAAHQEQMVRYQATVTQVSHQLHVALEEFSLVGQWVRASGEDITVQSANDGDTTSTDDDDHVLFRQTYEYVAANVLPFGSMGLARVVRTAEERERYEQATRTFLMDSIVTEDGTAGFNYSGFHNSSWRDAPVAMDREEYLPVHWVEPIVTDLESTFDWMDLDLLAHEELRSAVEVLRTTKRPVLTRCEPCFGDESAVLLHPGIPTSWEPFLSPESASREPWMDTISLVEIRFDWLLFRVFQRARIGHKMGLFIFDSTEEDEEPKYLSGAYYELLSEQEVPDSDIDPQDDVYNVIDAIVGRLQGSDPNIWTISSSIDFFKRQAVLDYTQPDGSITIEGASYRPYLPAQSVAEVQRTHEKSIVVQQEVFGFRRWTIVVTACDADYPLRQTSFIGLSAFFIVAVCCCLALWIWTSQRRSRKLAALRARSAAEKTDIVIRSARQAARNERDLNDYVAHEIRNPLAACLSACSFVSTAVNGAEPLRTEEDQTSVREDVAIIEHSLQFMNDLLRNMLDIHRASSKQLALQLAPLDVLHDVLEPTASMLYSRSSMFKVHVDCPENITIMADKLRLKQVVLNLGRNATKFVERGFIRLRGAVVDNEVEIYIEDSGPGIPANKREQLFQKFQESLDTLQQGTGIGLAVCRSIMDLMGGSITLDESYDSGIPGAPGSRFVLELHAKKMSPERFSFVRSNMGSDSYKSLRFRSSRTDLSVENLHGSQNLFRMSSLSAAGDTTAAVRATQTGGEPSTEQEEEENPIPDKMSVLFVDDDTILRKLFVRSLNKALPEWTAEQCSNGETALRLTDYKYFDIIFMDQYMASADRQLLGTETVRALRAKGVGSIICGLSANDISDLFIEAGSDHFQMKPLPCKPAALKQLILQFLIGYQPPFVKSLEV